MWFMCRVTKRILNNLNGSLFSWCLWLVWRRNCCALMLILFCNLGLCMIGRWGVVSSMYQRYFFIRHAPCYTSAVCEMNSHDYVTGSLAVILRLCLLEALFGNHLAESCDPTYLVREARRGRTQYGLPRRSRSGSTALKALYHTKKD